MNTFVLTLCDSRRTERFDTVTRFAGADAGGAFGVLPHHAELVAVLRYGLARFADDQGRWRYLALPGGVLHFCRNAMTIVTARYFLGDERDRIADQLAAEMAREDSELHASRATLDEIERTLLRRLGELGAQTGMPA
ncbi:MAG TPA: hypothetical protein VJ652_04060 [Noviherbaspirillum sp.]|nr:hypothetical protein [Noviherbaspirillum sp.]